jgi:nuclease-like protein
MVTRAGTSALEAYREARARKRNRLILAALAAGLGFAGWEAGMGPAPVLVATAAAAALVLAALATGGGDIGRWRRGALGERATADLLRLLPTRRWKVWHDLRVPGRRANIDHVVVGRTGVWVVDTKTTRAQVDARWRSVRLGGRKLDVGASIWECEVVSDLLAGWRDEEMPDPLPVRPIVVVHGPGLRPRGGRASGVPVVPADQLLRRLQRGRRRLSRRQIRVVSAAVEEAFGRSHRR